MSLVRGRYVLVGISSYTDTDCGSSKFPGVSTRVSHYLRWIREVMEDRSNYF